MKKTIIASWLIVLVLITGVFSACDSDTSQNNTSLPTTSSCITTDETFPDELDQSEYIITECMDFHGGYAAVFFEDINTEEEIFAVVDSNGECMVSNIHGFFDDDGELYTPVHTPRNNSYFDYSGLMYGKYNFTDFDEDCDTVYYDGYTFIKTRNSEDKYVFCLIDSNGKVVYSYEPENQDRVPGICYIGKGCWVLGEKTCISSKRKGLYEFLEKDTEIESVNLLGNGYVLVKENTADFYSSEEKYVMYDSTGQPIETSLSQNLMQDIAQNNAAPVGFDVIYWDKYGDNKYSFYNTETDKYWTIDSFVYVGGSGRDDVSAELIHENYSPFRLSPQKVFLFYKYYKYDGDKPYELWSCDTDGNQKSILSIEGTPNFNVTNYNQLDLSKGCFVRLGNQGNYNYIDFSTKKITPLTKEYSGKTVTAALPMQSVIAFLTTGSDGNSYQVLVDYNCDTIEGPVLSDSFEAYGPWLYFNDKIYNDDGKVIEINGAEPEELKNNYSEGFFTLATNYLSVDNRLLFDNEIFDESYFE